ncbi:MAG: TonB-dependent receptor [Candidatus Marinimicrobia bacterium]|nr:TonB-dependent receptor [Candidatus Neomarinimicrobiota bacterium]
MKHLFSKFSIFLTLVFCLLNSHLGWAGTTGKIAGRITDAKTGNPLPGVNVIVEGTTLGAATDLSGDYIILMLPPGVYSVVARMMGYDPLKYDQVRISIDKTRRLDFQLNEAVLEMGEEVTIVAERPLVQMDLTSTQSVISAETISMLPVENFNDVVNLQAGVVEGHFRGGRKGEVMYMIDGIPVNDVFSGEAAFQVENSAISELEVISGTFNAEYGQAMSGIVNIVTKEGGKEYHGKATVYFGDYLSSHKDIFWNIDKINPTYNGQLSLSGPLLPFLGDKISFFATARYYDTEGYIYGKDVFSPNDSSDFQAGAANTEAWMIEAHGKQYPFSEEIAQQLIEQADAVAMNPNKRISIQGKFTFKPWTADKFDYEIFYEKNKKRYYSHEFRLNPEAVYRRFDDGIKHSFSWIHMFGSRTFSTLKLSHFEHKYRQYVYEDLFDVRYNVPEQRLQGKGVNAFNTAGLQKWQLHRSTRTSLAKFDLTSQITKVHQLRSGLEMKVHKLWLHEYKVVSEQPDRMSPLTSFNNNLYTHYPYEFAGYIQDKIELDYMIVNAGVRFDYFNSKGQVPVNFKEPQTSPTEDACIATQVSPRFGLAYPITNQGKIHVSYGHFFQIPKLEHLFTNPEFDIFELQSMPDPPPNSTLNIVGNANLEPERTVAYEIGLQQQISEDFALDITAFYKDIRNLLGTEVLFDIGSNRYFRYINIDYGNIRGITLGLEKRQSGGIGASLDYTFQIAKGNHSDPKDAYNDVKGNREPTKQVLPLDWDRRHQLNMTVTLTPLPQFALSIIGRLGTGLPYTVEEIGGKLSAGTKNSGRRPTVYNFDVYTYKNFKLANLNLSLFFRIYNLLDRLNEINVYHDTGRATYSYSNRLPAGLRPQGINTYDDYIKRPDFYSAPREIQVGLEIEF